MALRGQGVGVSVRSQYKALSKAFEGSFRLSKLLSLKWTKRKFFDFFFVVVV